MSSKAIKDHVRQYYRRLFDGECPCGVAVLRGKDLAASLGYPLDSLGFISESYWEGFFPCGNPLPSLDLSPGDSILNIGCGAGIDSFALVGAFEPPITVTGLDVVPGVLAQARTLASANAATGPRFRNKGLHWVCGDGEALPFQTARFDWVILNGVLNLFPDKRAILAEIVRVLKPSGGLTGADLCCSEPLPAYFEEEWDGWAWCMSGACTEEGLVSLLHQSGLTGIRLEHEEDRDLLFRATFQCRKGELY